MNSCFQQKDLYWCYVNLSFHSNKERENCLIFFLRCPLVCFLSPSPYFFPFSLSLFHQQKALHSALWLYHPGGQNWQNLTQSLYFKHGCELCHGSECCFYQNIRPWHSCITLKIKHPCKAQILMQMNMSCMHTVTNVPSQLEQYKTGERDITLFVLWEHLDAQFPTGILKDCPAFDSENKGFRIQFWAWHW